VRRLGVLIEVDLNGGERNPLAVGRDGGLTDALELHHVFESEGVPGLGVSEKREGKQE